MTTRVAGVAIGVLALSVSLRAQIPHTEQASATASSVDPIGGLSLDDAIAQALQNEPGLQALRARVDVTRGLREQAGLRPNPSVSFFQQQEPAGTDRQTRLELQWPLDLFRKAGRTAVADREIEMA